MRVFLLPVYQETPNKAVRSTVSGSGSAFSIRISSHRKITGQGKLLGRRGMGSYVGKER